MEKMFGNAKHPVIPSVLGTTTSLQGLNPKVLEDYYTTWYVPENMALILVGDIDIDEAQSLTRN